MEGTAEERGVESDLQLVNEIERGFEEMLCYKELQAEEINKELFHAFIRRQVVTKCWRKENGQWVVQDAPFIDDWGEEEYEVLVGCLRNTVQTEGMVCGAFLNGKLKGFVSVEGALTGSKGQYMDLSSIHVSEDARRHGIGKELFQIAKRFAKERGAEKLYISAHSAVESQAFYRSMGCKEAEEYNSEHAEREPYDCQLECAL